MLVSGCVPSCLGRAEHVDFYRLIVAGGKGEVKKSCKSKMTESGNLPLHKGDQTILYESFLTQPLALRNFKFGGLFTSNQPTVLH